MCKNHFSLVVTGCNLADCTFLLGVDRIRDSRDSHFQSSFERGLQTSESAYKISPDKITRLQPSLNGFCERVVCLKHFFIQKINSLSIFI